MQENENEKLEKIITSSNRKIKIKYNEKKVKFAKEIIKYIDYKDLDILGLKRRLDYLFKNLFSWNHLESKI